MRRILVIGHFEDSQEAPADLSGHLFFIWDSELLHPRSRDATDANDSAAVGFLNGLHLSLVTTRKGKADCTILGGLGKQAKNVAQFVIDYCSHSKVPPLNGDFRLTFMLTFIINSRSTVFSHHNHNINVSLKSPLRGPLKADVLILKLQIFWFRMSFATLVRSTVVGC